MLGEERRSSPQKEGGVVISSARKAAARAAGTHQETAVQKRQAQAEHLRLHHSDSAVVGAVPHVLSLGPHLPTVPTASSAPSSAPFSPPHGALFNAAFGAAFGAKSKARAKGPEKKSTPQVLLAFHHTEEEDACPSTCDLFWHTCVVSQHIERLQLGPTKAEQNVKVKSSTL